VPPSSVAAALTLAHPKRKNAIAPEFTFATHFKCPGKYIWGGYIFEELSPQISIPPQIHLNLLWLEYTLLFLTPLQQIDPTLP
jgi:hypothetical protein